MKRIYVQMHRFEERRRPSAFLQSAEGRNIAGKVPALPGNFANYSIRFAIDRQQAHTFMGGELWLLLCQGRQCA
jgi:hypothetical protein